MRGIAIDRDNALRLRDDLPESVLLPGEVKIRMLAGGICGSDLAGLANTDPRPWYPWAIGHEGGGVVAEVSQGVTTLSVGDRVVIEPNYVCMECYWCLRGATEMCDNKVVVGRDRPGLFSEFVSVPAPFAWKVDDATPNATLASTEPSVVAHSAMQHFDLPSVRNALVVGAGSQGQIAAKVLVDAGLTPAISEPNRGNLLAAIARGGRDAADDLDELFDLVVETSGSAPGFVGALNRAQKLGQVCLIGQSTQPAEVVSRLIVQRELTVRGRLIYKHPDDFRSAIASIADGEFDPAISLRDPVGASVGVRDILRAHELVGKIWIDFGDWS